MRLVSSSPQTGRSPVSLDPQAPRHSRESGNLLEARALPAKRQPTPLPQAAPLPPRAHSALICAHSALTERSFSAHKALKRRSFGAHERSPPSGRRRPSPKPLRRPDPTRRKPEIAPATATRPAPSPSRSLNYDTRSLRPATPSAILTPMERSGRPAGQEGTGANERF